MRHAGYAYKGQSVHVASTDIFKYRIVTHGKESTYLSVGSETCVIVKDMLLPGIVASDSAKCWRSSWVDWHACSRLSVLTHPVESDVCFTSDSCLTAFFLLALLF